MRYAEAFKKLGYDLPNPRQHWSCSSESGVCLSLWHQEIDWKNHKFDTREDAGPPDTWNAAGANQRRRDLAIAVDLQAAIFGQRLLASELLPPAAHSS